MRPAPHQIGEYYVYAVAKTIPWLSKEELKYLGNSIDRLSQQRLLSLDKKNIIICSRKRNWYNGKYSIESKYKYILDRTDYMRLITDEIGKLHLSVNKRAILAVLSNKIREVMCCLPVDTIRGLVKMYGISRATFYNTLSVVDSGCQELLDMVFKNNLSIRRALIIAKLPIKRQQLICQQGIEAVVSYLKNQNKRLGSGDERYEKKGLHRSDAISTLEHDSTECLQTDAIDKLEFQKPKSKGLHSKKQTISWVKPGESPIPKALLTLIQQAHRMEINLLTDSGWRKVIITIDT